MTTGSIPKKIFLFSLPMIIGSIFQLTYATVDGIVIGRFVSKDALAAVGAATPIYNLLVFLLVGLCNGASILMSELYGAKRKKTLKENIGTSISAGVILSLVLTLLCATLSRPLLELTRVKPELLADASSYLTFAALGLVFTFIYNIYCAALRSTGDSVRPLYFLAVSSVFNIGLDLLFVLVADWGVTGAAAATSISQGLAAVICVVYAAKIDSLFRLRLEDLKIVWRQLAETGRYAVASALQQIVLFAGKALVQVSVNALSIDAQAAFTAAGKIDDYFFSPLQCIGNTAAVFIAQNRGAHHKERCKKGLGTGIVMSLVYAAVLGLTLYFVKAPVIRLFLDPADNIDLVVAEGVKYYNFMVFFFIFPALTNSIQSWFRGLGRLSIVFAATTVQIIFRVGSSFFLVGRYGISGAALCTAVGWTAMLLFEVPLLIYYLRTEKGLDRVSEIDVVDTKA